MATRSNINPWEAAKKRRNSSGGGCFYQLSWISDAQYIRASSEARNKAYCMAFDVHVGTGHGEKNDVKRHIERDCHGTTSAEILFVKCIARETCHWQ